MHIRQIDLNLFAIFDAIMTERSLSGAGDRLGMSQSGVSHALNRLRELTGDDLFVRTGKGVRPTHRATQMAESVKRALDLVQTSLLYGHDFDFQAAEREFVLDIPSGLETAIVPTFMTYISRLAPGIGLKINGQRAVDLVTELRYGETEMAIDYVPAGPPEYRSDLLYDDDLVCVMRADHPAANKSLGTDDYLRLPQVSLVAAHSDRDNVLTRTLHRQGLKRNVRLEVPSFASIPGIVVSTDLVATLPAGMARQYAQYFDFRILKLPIRTEPFRIFQVWHERFDDDAGHRWMRETMKEVCRRL